MSVNSSSSANSSLPPSTFSFSGSIFHHLHRCFNSTADTLCVIMLTLTNFLLLPLYILVLHLGFQRWRQQPANRTTSHSDVITYHMVVTELISVIGFMLICSGIYSSLPQMTTVGICCFILNFNMQMLFNLLICVERYLAVVHPVTYLSLRKENGIRIRNATLGCAWLLCIMMSSLTFVEQRLVIFAIYYVGISLILIVVSLCSLSVLFVLIRPGPGEAGGGRRQVDRAKLRAFYTIMAILGMLTFRFGGKIVATALYSQLQLGETERCVVWLSLVWWSLPSSVVLPLLFLQRAGKLLCCKNSNESGQ